MDLREVTPITDYFVICNGNSERQLKAMVDKIVESVREDMQVKPIHVEGNAVGGWVLLDYGDVVVHAFMPEQREYYDLEGLWNQGKTLLRMQ